MPKKFLLAFTVFIFFSLVFRLGTAMGDELDEINKQINELTQALNQSKAATGPLETQVQGIKQRISFIESDLIKKKDYIEKSYKDLAKQTDQLNLAIRNYYIKSYYNSPILIFLSANSASQITQILAYQKAAADQDKRIITNIALSINDLEIKKRNLEGEQVKLASAKGNLDKIIGDAKKYQSVLSGQIAELSAKQQQIINARSGSFTATIGDSELADDYNASIKGFRENAPSGYFAAFSFGAHTHRKGMSQYGARGRATQGQNANQILKAYYGKEPVNKDTGGTIKVAGFGEIDFEGKYLLGIAEMPSSWHPEALKAQAIAARTYALRYKVEGSEICTTEACQVYNDGKANSPPDPWKQAVESTRGQVLEDVVTYYASTHGGFASPIGWDTTDGSGGGNFTDKAYDKLGGSPWLYKAWYTKGYSPSSEKCGRNNPWLSPEDLADIVNAAIALQTGGIDTSRITPVTIECWGGNPYSRDELKNLVSGNGGISSATSGSVSQGNGSTNSVTINGITLNGSDFKRAFNLRAPGYLSIPQSGFAFYNIERK
ncbi:MAG: Stage II sporulation protein [Microgenomates group bacterium GW2011_GWA2_37_6]|nr:MAG: Stage II sporulation protein [Microgenomates group bacterium GW2011_GWA2_37_6]